MSKRPEPALVHMYNYDLFGGVSLRCPPFRSEARRECRVNPHRVRARDHGPPCPMAATCEDVAHASACRWGKATSPSKGRRWCGDGGERETQTADGGVVCNTWCNILWFSVLFARARVDVRMTASSETCLSVCGAAIKFKSLKAARRRFRLHTRAYF